jgi:hypothetical protein
VNACQSAILRSGGKTPSREDHRVRLTILTLIVVLATIGFLIWSRNLAVR